MTMAGHIRLLLLLFFSLDFQISQSSVVFKNGHDYFYTYAAESNILNLQNITTVAQIRIRHVNSTLEGDLKELFIDSFFQRTQEGHASTNPLNWTLSRPFLFHRDTSGEVTSVHYDEDDEPELVNFKKALASPFGMIIQESPQSVWSYSVNETDHSGLREHKYFAERRHDNAIHLNRYHRAVTDVERHHQQNIHISPSKEVHAIQASDKIVLKNTLPRKPERKPHPSEYTFDGKADGEFPVIESSSSLKLTLDHVAAHGLLSVRHHGLKKDSIVARAGPTKHTRMSDIRENITSALQCIENIENKYAPERTECVHSLKTYLDMLHPRDLTTLATGVLNQTCKAQNRKCQDRRFLIIDMLCRIGKPEAQTLIVKYVLKSVTPHEEELRRTLFHYADLKQPQEDTVKAVQDLCFGPNEEKHGTHNNTKDTRRACLTLGAIARTLSGNNDTISTRIVEKISGWLEKHDGTYVEPARERIRRSVVPPKNKTDDIYRLSKTVLIEALGNTAHEKALDHILSYTRPNVGHSVWRRSGVHALRWYKCKKSAEALMDAAINDEQSTVRHRAFEMYSKHPQKKNMRKEEENGILSKRYTYPTVMQVRSKRGILADILKFISFKLELPGMDWSKKIGTDDIGASFGLIIRNKLELELKPLSGFFEIDVYNTAWVTGLLGIIGQEVDIFRVLACYQGHIRYDLNILKDFGINDIQDLANLFDKIIGSVRDPIENAVKAIKMVIDLFKKKGLKGIVDDLIKIVREFPNRLKELVERLIQFAKDVSDYDGLPWVRAVKKVIYNVKYFVEDVKNDIMNFYNSIVDTITVTLPFVIRNVVDAIKLIVESIKSLFQNPTKAISQILKAVLKVRMSISMVIGAKQKIQESCFFMSGKLPYWMKPGEELKHLVEDIKVALQLVGDFIRRARNFDTSSIDFRVGPGDGILTQEEQEAMIAKRFKEMLEDTLSPMDELKTIAKPFVDAYQSVFGAIKAVKKAYYDLKSMVNKGRSLIQKAFGPKFHDKFPTTRVDCEKSDCACGLFPSDSNGKLNDGVDVRANRDKEIVCPVMGMVKRRNGNEILIEPASIGDFSQYEIILTNVAPRSNIRTEGTPCEVGKKIGKVARTECKISHVHVAMRKIPPSGEKISDDDEYEYVDPTPFLDRIFPVPEWIEDCKEFTITFIGVATDIGEIVDGDGEKTDEKIQRDGGNVDGETTDEKSQRVGGNVDGGTFGEKIQQVGKNIENTLQETGEKITDYAKENWKPTAVENWEDMDLTYRPPGMDTSTTNTLKDSFQAAADTFKNPKKLFDKFLKPTSILDALNVNEFTLNKVLEILDSGSVDKKETLIGMMETYSNYLREQPIQHPNTFSPRRLRYLLQRKRLDDGGSFEQMVVRYIECPKKDFPHICGGVARDYGLFCRPHIDALGVTCGIVFQLNFFRKVMKLDLRVHHCAQRIDVTFGKNMLTFNLTDGKHEIVTPIGGFDDMAADLNLIIKHDADKVFITLLAGLCSNWYPTCTQEMRLLNEMEITATGKSCVEGPENDPTTAQVRGMSIQYFADDFLEANLGNRIEILTFLNELRAATLDALFNNPDLMKKIQGTEFPDKTDFCISGDVPIPPLDTTFFKFDSLFMIGPVPLRLALGSGGSIGLRLEVGACFVSMTAFVRATPFAGAKVYGRVAIDIFIAAAGLELTGYLLETRFPTTGTIKFDKFPLDVGARMDLILVPLRFKLSAFLELRLIIVTLKSKFKLWEYAVPSINFNIFDIPLAEDDKSPPETLPTSLSRRKRNINKGCTVTQLEGRDPTDPAFLLEVSAQDEVSDIKRRYTIGSHLGGNNIQDWTEMGGASVIVPALLENGIPLYWTVKIANSQGLEATAQCSLNTYDTTPPDGRVEPSYALSSHPHKLSATLVLIDDSPLAKEQFKAVGFGQGAFGNSVIDWEIFEPDRVTTNTDASGDLTHFSVPRRGRLTSEPFKKAVTFTDELCAKECIKYGAKCISFDFDSVTEACYLQETVQGDSADLKHSGYFHNYERIIGHTSIFWYDNVRLSHAEVFYITAHITNSLGYVSYLSTSGTIIDFTPPEPGFISNVTLDVVIPDGCSASVTQRCKDVTWHPNHRKIIDGAGSKTVFNGHERMFDLRYTLDNHFISGHWDGFTDPESDIWGYTWGSGSTICGTDVSPYDDPHSHLSGKSFWTHHGLATGLHLADGPYYVTVQAINSVVYGGALVTTLCHSQPLVVDTTKPIMHPVDDYVFDEDFDLLLMYYNASDSLSEIERVDFGLGHTKYDVKVRAYSRHDHTDGDETYIAVDGIGLQDGEPAWIRLRAMNSVQLFAAGHSTHPIMIDRTKPVRGEVYDGHNVHIDLAYQSDNTTLCAHWKDFFDPHSGIQRFIVGFGLKPDHTTSLVTTELSHLTKTYCYKADLAHNQTYYATVVALNRGLNPKRVNASSDGVLVDVTPPSIGWVGDGIEAGKDIQFTHKQAEVSANFRKFDDFESGIESYEVSVFINGIKSKVLDNGQKEIFEEHSFSLQSGDHTNVKVTARNGAGSVTSNVTDGVIVDLTPPVMVFLHDSIDGKRYQTRNDGLQASWNFKDQESGISEYRLISFEYREGIKIKMSEDVVIPPTDSDASGVARSINMSLVNGARYTVQVTSINHAQLSTTHETDGVRVDTTPPKMDQVIIGLTRDEEEINSDGEVLHLERESILASWLAHDEESDVASYLVGVGTRVDDVSLTNGYINFGPATHGHITGLSLDVTSETNVLYYVIVKAINGAGIESINMTSYPIYVLRENIPGIVLDGRTLNVDENVQSDSSSIAMNFFGFESESCGIVTYEWAIGTKPGFSDVQQFSNYGLVMKNKTHGHAESNIRLDNDVTYFTTVRAITGHNCHEDLIVSASDGILVDTVPPKVTLTRVGENRDVENDGTYYQTTSDDIEYHWQLQEEESNVELETWIFGSLPSLDDIHNKTVADGPFVPLGSISLPHAATGFLTVEALDSAGNNALRVSPSLTIDTTPPIIAEFTCSPYLSHVQTTLACRWNVVESESFITSITIEVGHEEGGSEITTHSLPSVSKRHWQFNAYNLLIHDKDIQVVYVSLNVTNNVNLNTWLPSKVIVDNTPPEGGTVRVVTDFSDDNQCQTSQTHVNIVIEGFEDYETDIHRYEICLGSLPRADDVASTRDIGTTTSVTLDGIYLRAGSTVYVTVKAYNKVGLSSVVSSRALKISPYPGLTVNDGMSPRDISFQHSLSVISAYWEMDSGCPLSSVNWSIFRIDGVTIKTSAPVPLSDNLLIDDSVNLENDKTYFVEVEVTDVLHRIFRSKTNGVGVSMESPKPGMVLEGEDGDSEYQCSNSRIHARWDEFGERASKNPSQIIVDYDVALGDGRFSQQARENVHPFISVGLNKSFTFTNLNLTAKTVKYYVSVRAHSASGTTVTVSSNGLLVGFIEGITASTIVVPKAQSDNTSIEVSWSEFESDLPILRYEIGISSTFPALNRSCDMPVEHNQYDVYSLTSVGVDTVHTVTGLSLRHDQLYYVTVRCLDVAGNCQVTTSSPIIFDQSPPEAGHISVGTMSFNQLSYVKLYDSLFVEWNDFFDDESAINHYDVSLFEQQQCQGQEFNERFLVQIHPSVRVINDSEILFDELALECLTAYFVKIVATNGAGLSVVKWSLPILVDDSAPIQGSLKYGLDWTKNVYFQTSLSEIETVIAIDHSNTSGQCESQIPFDLVTPSGISSKITVYDSRPKFQRWMPPTYYVKDHVIVGHGDSLKLVSKSTHFKSHLELAGFAFDLDVHEGNYTATVKAIEGQDMVTSLVVTEEERYATFERFVLPDVKRNPDEKDFKVADLNSNRTRNAQSNITTHETTNITYNESASIKAAPHYKPSVGVHILGFDIDGTKQVLFWAVGEEDNIKEEWFDLDFDTHRAPAEYKITIEKDESTGVETWNSRLLVANKERAVLFGIQKPGHAKLEVRVWNRNEVVPQPLAESHLYESEATICDILVAVRKDHPCSFGKAFYDQESKIKEIWMGIGSQNNGSTDVLSMELVKQPCAVCAHECDYTCHPGCSAKDFELYNISLNNLSLGVGSWQSLNDVGIMEANSTEVFFEPSTYFVVVKVVNFAGESTTVIGDGITIDVTPPNCTSITCIDPTYSMLEPITYLGSNDSLGAYWECTEDASLIARYEVSVGTEEGLDDVRYWRNVKLDDKVGLDNFQNPLTHDTKYWFNVKAFNRAGLSSQISCSVVTDLVPPDTTNMTLDAIRTNTDPRLPSDVCITDSATSAGVKWTHGPASAVVYELEIETEQGKHDVLPPVAIGLTDSTEITIADGRLSYDKNTPDTSLSLFAKRNYTADEIEDVKQDTFYEMEPGRCTYQTLYALNRAHLKSIVSTQLTCVKRPSDEIVDLRSGDLQQIDMNYGDQPVVSSISSGEGRPSDLHIEVVGNSSLFTGLLLPTDMNARYGCAASNAFAPFIQDPRTATKGTMVSRRMRKRYKKYAERSFFLAPAGNAIISEPIMVEMKFDPVSLGADEIPVLMYYDPDERKWIEACESCGTCNDSAMDKDVNWEDSFVRSQICGYRAERKREKRSADMSFVLQPVAYSLINAGTGLFIEGECSWQCSSCENENSEYEYHGSWEFDGASALSQFSCEKNNDRITGVSLSYTIPTGMNVRSMRLLVDSGSGPRESCVDDDASNGLTVDLNIEPNTTHANCNIQANNTDTSFRFYLTNSLGHVTRDDFLFTVDCAAEKCFQTVSDVDTRPLVIQGYVVQLSDINKPINVANTNDKIAIVVKLKKTPIAQAISVNSVTFSRKTEPLYEMILINNSCGTQHKELTIGWGKEVGFEFLQEDGNHFYVVSPEFNSTTLGIHAENDTVEFIVSVRRCVTLGDRTCYVNNCPDNWSDKLSVVHTASIRISLEMVQEIYSAEVDYTTIYVTIPVVLVITVAVIFGLWMRKRTRRKRVVEPIALIQFRKPVFPKRPDVKPYWGLDVGETDNV